MKTQPMSWRSQSSSSGAGYACSITSRPTPDVSDTRVSSARHVWDMVGLEPYMRAQPMRGLVSTDTDLLTSPRRSASPFPGPGDEARAAGPGDIRPGQFEEHQEAIAEADQEDDVHEEPCEPRRVSGQPESSNHRDSRGPPDRGHAAPIAVAEGQVRSAAEPTEDIVRRRAALLDRHRSDAGQRRARLLKECAHVAHAEHLGRSRPGHIPLHPDLP